MIETITAALPDLESSLLAIGGVGLGIGVVVLTLRKGGALLWRFMR